MVIALVCFNCRITSGLRPCPCDLLTPNWLRTRGPTTSSDMENPAEEREIKTLKRGGRQVENTSFKDIKSATEALLVTLTKFSGENREENYVQWLERFVNEANTLRLGRPSREFLFRHNRRMVSIEEYFAYRYHYTLQNPTHFTVFLLSDCQSVYPLEVISVHRAPAM
uniref:Ras-GEF domain-containing protein n=1 Tax=Caenorhabditis tropicalis TaxID=1561998 RepID=A0A1I7U260_9PELO